jgi:predicted amidophosphoribosyltransferase
MSALYHAAMSFLDEGFMREMRHTLRIAIRSVIEVIFPPSDEEVMVRNTTRDEVARLVAPELVMIDRLSTSTTATSLLPYRIPLVQALITEAKFERNRRAQMLLGSVLAGYIKVSVENLDNLVLVPLPLGDKRRKERGYNQVEEIAKCAAHQLSTGATSAITPIAIHIRTDILMRTRETLPQTSLGRKARLENMRGAFGAPHVLTPPMDASLIYLLLDDVVTTGATLSAAHAALMKAGAGHIIVLALAH